MTFSFEKKNMGFFEHEFPHVKRWFDEESEKIVLGIMAVDRDRQCLEAVRSLSAHDFFNEKNKFVLLLPP